MQEYIRIDEAVRKYGKTRQTFYNYINKGILEVKKINNRLFLDIHAIENLMNTIIEEPSEISEHIIEQQV
jgi:ACT domain-containing protein